ncbi:MAG: hypothetical protein U0Y10_21405 [Spirosomataceae bacterium]
MFRVSLIVSFILLSKFVFSQAGIDLQNGKSVVYEDFEYGFDFDRKKERKSLLSTKEFEEYEVTVFVKNRKKSDWLRFVYSDGHKILCDFLADFSCFNAIEKNGFSTSVVLYGKPKVVPYTQKEFNTIYFSNVPIVFGTYKKQELLIGYELLQNDVVTATIKVLVKKGDVPLFKVKPYGR